MTFPPATALKPLESAGFPAPRAAGGGAGFSLLDTPGVIAHPRKGASGPAEPGSPQEHDQLVKFTQQWVAQTFFGTLMRQMRESPFKSDLFEGGRGGQAFTSLYDQRLVEQMGRGAGNKLVNAIVHTIEKNLRKTQAGAAYGKQAAGAAAVATESLTRRAVPAMSGSSPPHNPRPNVAPAHRS